MKSRFVQLAIVIAGCLGLCLRHDGGSRRANAAGPADKKVVERPTDPGNLAYVGNGAKPATASSELDNPKHKAPGLNDGKYGNDYSWIPVHPNAWFQIELAKTAKVGRFKLGRDRVSGYDDRALQSLKIELSADGRTWQTAYMNKEIRSIPGYEPTRTLQIQIAPVEAHYVKVEVEPPECCIDEFEVFGPAASVPAKLPDARMLAPFCPPRGKSFSKSDISTCQ